jgi:hypothetical protein
MASLWKEGIHDIDALQFDRDSSIVQMDEEVKQGQAEAEDMIVEAYTALLLAFLSKERYPLYYL